MIIQTKGYKKPKPVKKRKKYIYGIGIMDDDNLHKDTLEVGTMQQARKVAEFINR